MEAYIKYHEILEEDLVIEIEWLKEEFEILFKSKMDKYTQMDKIVANDLLNYILNSVEIYNNYLLLKILDKATKSIKKKYLTLFI